MAKRNGVGDGIDRHRTFNAEVEKLLNALQDSEEPSNALANTVRGPLAEDRSGAKPPQDGLQLNATANQCLQRTLAVGRGVPMVRPRRRNRSKSPTDDSDPSMSLTVNGRSRRWSGPTTLSTVSGLTSQRPDDGQTRYQSAPVAPVARNGTNGMGILKASMRAELVKAPAPQLGWDSSPSSPAFSGSGPGDGQEGSGEALRSPQWVRAIASELHATDEADSGEGHKKPSGSEEESQLVFHRWFKQLGLESQVANFTSHGVTTLRQLLALSEAQLKVIAPKLSDRRPIAMALTRLQTDLAVQTALPGSQEARVALLIGNSNYAHYPPLPKAAVDVKALGQVLREQLHFHALTLVDSSLKQVFNACQEVIGQSRRCGGPVVLLYYSGHAVQLEGQNYLLPVDCQRPLPSNYRTALLNLNALVAQLAQGQPSLTILLLDACHHSSLSGVPLNEGRDLHQLRPVPLHPFKPKPPEDDRYDATRVSQGPMVAVPKEGLAPFQLEANNTCVMFAAAPNQTSVVMKEKDATSIFCSTVIRHFTHPSVPISVTLQDISAEVQALTLQQQKPWVLYRANGPQFYLLPVEGGEWCPTPADQLSWTGWDDG